MIDAKRYPNMQGRVSEMGKKRKKVQPEKLSKNYKICERCGNGGITRAKQFKCRYCGWQNGLPEGIVVTYGGLEDDRY